MGIISNKAKAPKTVAAPVVIPASTPTVSTTSTELTTTNPVKTDTEIASEARSQSLLNRSRGRLGTVLTSFRGLLSDKADDFDPPRKTLLGE